MQTCCQCILNMQCSSCPIALYLHGALCKTWLCAVCHCTVHAASAATPSKTCIRLQIKTKKHSRSLIYRSFSVMSSVKGQAPQKSCLIVYAGWPLVSAAVIGSVCLNCAQLGESLRVSRSDERHCQEVNIKHHQRWHYSIIQPAEIECMGSSISLRAVCPNNKKAVLEKCPLTSF